MNDQKENKLSMYLTVKAHLDENNGTYTTITGYTALKNEFFTCIDSIFSLNGILETDTTGTAETKALRREALIEMFHRVHRGLSGYGAINDDRELLRIVDFSSTEINRMRDSELYTVATTVSSIPDEINDWPALAPYHLTPSDVDNLNTARANYLVYVPKTGIVQGRKSDALIDLNEIFEVADGILKNKMDYLAATLASSFPVVYGNYLQVRAIDDTGAYTPATYTGTANPGTITLIGTYPYNPARSFRMKNNGTDVLNFGLGIDLLSILPPGVVINGNSQSTRLSNTLALSGENLLVQNTGTLPMDYSVWVLEP